MPCINVPKLDKHGANAIDRRHTHTHTQLQQSLTQCRGRHSKACLCVRALFSHFSHFVAVVSFRFVLALSFRFFSLRFYLNTFPNLCSAVWRSFE